MPLGSILRPLALVLVLLTASGGLVSASHECATTPLFTLCPADVPGVEPSRVRAGEIGATEGSAHAAAEGGVAAGVGQPVVFVLDYEFAQGVIPSGRTFSFHGVIRVLDSNGAVLNVTSVNFFATSADAPYHRSGKLYLNVSPGNPRLEGGAVTLESRVSTSGPGGWQLLGSAASTAPVRLATTPPREAYVSDDTRTTDDFLAGTFHATPSGLTAAMVRDATLVSPDTFIRFRISGEFEFMSAPGPWESVTEDVLATMNVKIEDGPSYFVQRVVRSMNCTSSGSSTPECEFLGGSESTSLEIVVPGSALRARSVALTSVHVTSWASAWGPSGSADANVWAGDGGRNVVYVAGTP